MIQNSWSTPPNDDSICRPIVQLMTTVNQQQMRVRKPSESSDQRITTSIPENKILNPKSPTLTQVSLQLASERVSPNQAQDLLLIQEEISMKEDSQQNSIFRKNNESGFIYRKIQKVRNSLSSVTLIRDRNHLIQPAQLTKIQFKLINDLGAEFQISRKKRFIQQIKENNLLKQCLLGIYCIFLSFYLTVMLIEIGCDNLNYSNYISFQCILFFTQIIRIIYQLIVKLQSFKESILELLTIIPFAAFFQGNLNVQKYLYFIYLIKVKTIIQFIQELNYYTQMFEYVFILKSIIQIHFVSFFCLTCINLMRIDNQLNWNQYLNEIFLIFYTPDINGKFSFIVYLIKILLLIYYIYILKGILTYVQIQHDQFQHYKPLTQKQILECINDNLKIRFDINQMPIQLQNEMKRQKYLNIIKQIPIFKESFQIQTLLKICDLIEEINLQSNTILKQDESLYIHLEGQININQYKENGSFQLSSITNKFQIFNHYSFFMNQSQNLIFQSNGYSKIARLDSNKFNQFIKLFPKEFQKYKMLTDTINNNISLADIRCYSCKQYHDVTQCPILHYKPNRQLIISQYQYSQIQKRIGNFNRQPKTKRRQLVIKRVEPEDSESFESEEQDKVEMDHFLPSSYSLNSITPQAQQNNFNLDMSSVHNVNQSHSGQTLFSKKVDSDIQALVFSNSGNGSSSRKIQMEQKEIMQSKFQKYAQNDEQYQSFSAVQVQIPKAQDSMIYTKRIQKNQQSGKKQDQFTKQQTDIPLNRRTQKTNTYANPLNSNDQIFRRISIEENFQLSFDRISKFDDYFPHYNVDQQINNYQRIQSLHMQL